MTFGPSPVGAVPGNGFLRGRPRGRLTGAVPDRASAFRIIASIRSIAEGLPGGAASASAVGGISGTGSGGMAEGTDGGRVGVTGIVPGSGYFLGRPRGRFTGIWGGTVSGAAGGTA